MEKEKGKMKEKEKKREKEKEEKKKKKEKEKMKENDILSLFFHFCCIIIYLKRVFIFDFNYQNFNNSYDSLSIIGSQLENQDNYFFYNCYFLIKNLTFFCVLDGYGKNGKEVSKYISILFPSYLFYLLADNNLSETKLEINKEIMKLIKLENPL